MRAAGWSTAKIAVNPIETHSSEIVKILIPSLMPRFSR